MIPVAPASAFSGLGLAAASLEAVAAAGFAAPTPVQERAIPPALAGRDVIACAATGTGKTAAFVLPFLERLAGRRGTRVLVLAPTRELVQQIGQTVAAFGRARAVRHVEVVGGLGMGPQATGLRERREVVVATPGRLIDHLDRGTARLDGIEVLVLDEADRMLDLGFKPQLDRILAHLPAERQTMLFSATMGREVADFARSCLRDPVRIEIARTGTVAPRAEQRVFHVPQLRKPDLLLALLAADAESTLVFTRTKHRAEKLGKLLHRAGHAVARIHGDRSQSQRQDALDGFRTGRYRVLVATDVAARGLDVEEIGHVVNFDLSLVPEDHVHRVGRTARASASGRASSFCSPEEVQLLRAIERFTRTPIRRGEMPAGIEPATGRPADAPAPVADDAAASEDAAAAPGPDRPAADDPAATGAPRRHGRPSHHGPRRPHVRAPHRPGREEWRPRHDASGPHRPDDRPASDRDGFRPADGRPGHGDRPAPHADRRPSHGGPARDRPRAGRPHGAPSSRAPAQGRPYRESAADPRPWAPRHPRPHWKRRPAGPRP